MLSLKNIVKTYTAGDTKVQALRGISLDFRESEFVAVLGPSGCGKTTLLNIVGGLDKYDSGDLVINDISTKKYADSDWDSYRNHRIGFVFQSYNLIPHQTVLANVELALTLSGVSKTERRRRAAEALTAVGLGDQLKKKPNQMSGGQMQRVAIARALVNNPDILLADEPTGALDTETSVQIMNILREISKRRLIIMVTHNPDIADAYATRTVKMLDGEILHDTNPPAAAELAAASDDAAKAKKSTEKREKKKTGKTSMSFFTALSLSLNNLMTKKTRTFLTSFAGSIGIIGIALIAALSNGVQAYINQVQEDTLSSYPIQIEAESIDLGSLIRSISGISESASEQKDQEELGDNVYSNAIMYELMNTLNSTQTTTNNLSAFREYLLSKDENGMSPLDNIATAVKYEYGINLPIYATDTSGQIARSDVAALIADLMSAFYGVSGSPGGGGFMSSMTGSSGMSIWEEMLSPSGSDTDDDGYLINPLLREQYDVIYGDWPTKYNEIVLIVDNNNTVSDLVLYSLGLISADEMINSFSDAAAGKQIQTDSKKWSFEDICGITLKLIPDSARYSYNSETGKYTDLTSTDAGLSYLYSGAEELKITGIVRTSASAVSGMLSGSIGYTSALTDYVIDASDESELIKAQLANPGTDIFTGLPFKDENAAELSADEMAEIVRDILEGASSADKAEAFVTIMSTPTEEYINSMVEMALAGMTRQVIEEMMVAAYLEQMQSVDIDAVKGYIASMDDATIFGYAREMLAIKYAEEYAAAAGAQLAQYTIDQLAAMYDAADFTDEQYAQVYDTVTAGSVSDSTYEKNLELLGYVDRTKPSSISIYAATFADKEKISDIISGYNSGVAEEDKISYTDYVALLMSSITTIINAISYILIAFVSVSLVVSSIMIGIITYISVLERTKEIGILRSIGASKRDVTRVFNAETLIVGFAAGAIGILVTVLLCIPINIIIRHLTSIPSLGASLPPLAAVILLAISMLLTLFAGLVPSFIAAKKDPVVALRTD